MTYKESIEICEKALDILDLKKFLISGKEVREVINSIEDYLENNDEEEIQKLEYFMKDHPDIFGKPPELFNFMLDYEFLKYCSKKYPEIHWGHENIERYWVI